MKQKLIDANVLVPDARFGEDEIPFVSLKQIGNAPEIEAIPIDFIKQVIEDKRYILGHASDKVAPYYLHAVRALENLLWEWGKTNG